ncbi:TPA: VOC family protein, partial [Escherichia coli]|nr:VOC family protein [Escherichia coli]
FQFNQGNSNALVQLDFLTDTAALKGQTILVGEGRYAFH